MKYIIICISFFLTPAIISAQNKPRSVFNSYNAVGLTVGESAHSIIVETVNGLKKGRWFAGAGLAFDAYSYKTVPVYLDLKYFFGDKKQFFVRGDIGYGFIKKATYQQDKFFDTVKYKGGIYLQSGIGYLLTPAKKHSFYFSVNCGLKKLSKNAGYIIPDDFPPYNETYVAMDKYDYNFKTISIKAGYKF